MSDLIDRQEVLSCFHDWIDKYGDVHTADEMPEYKAIEALPSAQPEIIRCKDCENWALQVKDVKGDGLGSCAFHKANFVTGEGYCYWAERREDG